MIYLVREIRDADLVLKHCDELVLENNPSFDQDLLLRKIDDDEIEKKKKRVGKMAKYKGS